jgi:hypothetical protein
MPARARPMVRGGLSRDWATRTKGFGEVHAETLRLSWVASSRLAGMVGCLHVSRKEQFNNPVRQGSRKLPHP